MIHFIGWEGIHYICAHDWRKKVPIGHTRNISLKDAFKKRMELHAFLESVKTCDSCEWDIKNRIKDTIKFLSQISANEINSNKKS